MLKNIREGAIENPWFFRISMMGIALVFALSMGWWGFGGDDRDDNVIAKIGEDVITITEYQRAYRNETRFYRNLFQDDYDYESLRKQVIDGMVERKLWLQTAKRMRLAISDTTLKDSVMSMGAFQEDGEFNPKRYQRALSFEKYTPETFEVKHREALMVRKAQTVIKDGVALTVTEIKEAGEGDPNSSDPVRTVEQRLSQKKERAVRAYVLSLKAKSSITIKEELL